MADETITIFEQSDVEQNKVMAMLACFGILFWLPLVTCKDSPIGRYYANYGLLVLLTAIVGAILNVIPIIGWIVGWVVNIFSLVCCILGLIAASKGTAQKFPFIGTIELIK